MATSTKIIPGFILRVILESIIVAAREFKTPKHLSKIKTVLSSILPDDQNLVIELVQLTEVDVFLFFKTQLSQARPYQGRFTTGSDLTEIGITVTWNVVLIRMVCSVAARFWHARDTRTASA